MANPPPRLPEERVAAIKAYAYTIAEHEDDLAEFSVQEVYALASEVLELRAAANIAWALVAMFDHRGMTEGRREHLRGLIERLQTATLSRPDAGKEETP